MARSLNPNIPEINAIQRDSDSALGSCTREHFSAPKDANGLISAETSPRYDKFQAQKQVEMYEVNQEKEQVTRNYEEVKRKYEEVKRKYGEVKRENDEVKKKSEEDKKEHDALRLELSRHQRREAELRLDNQTLRECVSGWKRKSDGLENTIQELQESLHTAILEIKVRKNGAEDLLEPEARQEIE